MAVITAKELSFLKDQLDMENTLIRKYRAYAEDTADSALKSKFTETADRHQKHFDALYAQLK